MAFCGVDFSKETKEERKCMDHSLKNVLPFSTGKKQMAGCSKEGLLLKNKQGVLTDRRIKINYKDKKFQFQSFSDLCQLKGKFPNGLEGIGSCLLAYVNQDWFVLTCAHNLALVSTFSQCKLILDEGFVYAGRQGEKLWDKLYTIDPKEVLVHPKFNGEPHCGYDVGICRVTLVNNMGYGYHSDDHFWHFANPKDLKIGMEVEVGGYPGEKNGFPYYHTGKIVYIKETSQGGWLLYYDVDTTPGTSGSPIRIIDESYVKKHTFDSDKKKITIGVHTGHDYFEGLNFGTLITSELYMWIHKLK